MAKMSNACIYGNNVRCVQIWQRRRMSIYGNNVKCEYTW